MKTWISLLKNHRIWNYKKILMYIIIFFREKCTKRYHYKRNQQSHLGILKGLYENIGLDGNEMEDTYIKS